MEQPVNESNMRKFSVAALRKRLAQIDDNSREARIIRSEIGMRYGCVATH